MSDNIRVLLVDDEAIYLESLAKLLRRKGMEVLTAPSGSTAISLISQNECDVIVLDLRMPEMDGLATLQEIRKLDTLTPVLMLTGYIDLDRVTQALKGGIAEVLLKPCPADVLVSAIENARERKVIARQIAGAGSR